jgi:transcriptional regulator with XRE-family HTH domain
MNSPGNILKEERLTQKLSLEDISEKTKIRVNFLAAIEDDDYAVLPPVYIRSFIKSYAQALRIPHTDMISQIDSILNLQKPKELFIQPSVETSEPDDSQMTKKTNGNQLNKNKYSVRQTRINIINYSIYSGLILAAIALIYFSIFSGKEGENRSDLLGVESADTTNIKEDKEESGGLFSFLDKSESDSLVLEAVAVDTVWLRIDMDGKYSAGVTLYPEMKMRWSAMKYFIISLGNAGGVTFYRDGSKLEPFGKKGIVIRNLKITRDKIESSAEPWNKKNEEKKKEKPRKSPPMIEESPIKSGKYN